MALAMLKLPCTQPLYQETTGNQLNKAGADNRSES